MSKKSIIEHFKSANKQNVLLPTHKNNNFIVKEDKYGDEAFFHISGKKIYDIPKSYNSENIFEYDYYENGLLILTHQYSNFDYCGTTIEFFNNKGTKVLKEFYWEDEESTYIVSVFKDKIKCELGKNKIIVKNINQAVEKEEDAILEMY